MISNIGSFRYRQPDGQIKTASTAYVGDNIYNATGASQTRSLTVHRNTTGSFTIAFTNDGIVNDNFLVKGAGSGGGFTVKYLNGATDITAQVVAGTYAFTNVAPNTSRAITLQVTVASSVTVGAVKAFLVTASSSIAGAAKDTVKASVTAS
jgi:uncharacterized membrane protein